MLGLIGALDEEVAMLHADIDVSKEAALSSPANSCWPNQVGKVKAAICAQMLIDLYQLSAVAAWPVDSSVTFRLAIIASHLIQRCRRKWKERRERSARPDTCGLSNVPFVVIRWHLRTEMEGAAVVLYLRAQRCPVCRLRGMRRRRDTSQKKLHKVCKNSYRILEEFVPLWGEL